RLDTWITSGCSKQRTTWQMASTSRMWARNLLPRPSPLAAPATSPAMSTNSTAVGTTRSGFTMSASAFRRGSGTGTTPTLGSMVQNGKLAAAMPALVSALNRVDLPTFGRPTMPHLMPISNPQRRERGTVKSSLLLFPVPRSLFPLFAVEALHGLVEVAGDGQRQYVERVVDGAQDRGLVVAVRAA